MIPRLIEAVPNFSEGLDRDVIDFIAQGIGVAREAWLLDRTSDRDHNRSVLTIAGTPESVQAVALEMVGRAAERIDLRNHRGVHPRLGACDVLPFVPIAGVTLEDCAALARATGAAIWERFRIPVFFYEAAASSPERVPLESIRAGGFERNTLKPDIGDGLHPSAGGAIVGARPFLIAYNINLATPDVALARAIARKIRASSGGLPNVKALGLFLETRGQAQVSMNLTDFEVTSIDTVHAAVSREATLLGTEALSSEIIGLIPRRALPTTDVRWENFDESKILENRLEAAIHSESSVG